MPWGGVFCNGYVHVCPHAVCLSLRKLWILAVLRCALPWIHTEDIAHVLCRWEDTVIQQMRARASCSSLNSLVAFTVETKISRFAPRWSWKFLSEWPRDMSWYVIAMVLWFGESFCQRSMTSQTGGTHTHTSDPPKQMKMGRNEGLNSCLSMRIYASLIKIIPRYSKHIFECFLRSYAHISCSFRPWFFL